MMDQENTPEKVHPLVKQLRFARSEFLRNLEGLSEEDSQKRLEPMNCIGWIVAHLAWQEQTIWLMVAQGETPFPELHELAGHDKPASTPGLAEALEKWRAVTAAADPYLDTLDTQKLQEHFEWRGRTLDENIGTRLLRVLYHYWYHIGEANAIRQMLGHKGLPEFVGDILNHAPYTPER
jgi:uncharacterized damage-inducible protein DinB